MDTTKYSNGPHVLGIDAEDKAGNVALFSRIPIVIDNLPSAVKPQ
jgi:hypothetical protein